MSGIKRFQSRTGLTLINETTVPASSTSVTVSDVFTSAYINYKIIINGGTATGAGTLGLRLTPLSGGPAYYAGYTIVTHSTGAVTGAADNNPVGQTWSQAGVFAATYVSMNVDVLGPNLAKPTFITGMGQVTTTASRTLNGFLNDTAQYTGFAIFPSGGFSISDALISVYGYNV